MLGNHKLFKDFCLKDNGQCVDSRVVTYNKKLPHMISCSNNWHVIKLKPPIIENTSNKRTMICDIKNLFSKNTQQGSTDFDYYHNSPIVTIGIFNLIFFTWLK